MGKNIAGGALIRTAMNSAKTTGGAGGVTAVADLAGAATTIGLPGSAGTHIGSVFRFASQSAPLAVTVENGTVAGQVIEVAQLQGAANAITLADSGGTVLVLTTALAVDSSGKLVWNGTNWLAVGFGAGATSA